MTASEFAFLALGLVLGVASGAALSIVIRARPPAPHEVRVTMAPGAVPTRPSATLQGLPSPGSQEASAVAAESPVRPDDGPVPVSASTARAATVSASEAAMGTSVRTPVGVAIHPEHDPLVRALGDPTAFLALGRSAVDGRTSGPLVIGAVDVVPIAVAGRPGPAVGASSAAAAAVGSTIVAVLERPEPQASAKPDPIAPAALEPAAGSPADRPVARDGLGACAEERRVAEERCALADRLREASSAAADRLRAAQLAVDEHEDRANRAAAAADPRAIRAAKELALATFRAADSGAMSREAVEIAARDWLLEIDRINRAAREAAATATREREAAAALIGPVERLSLEADAARINAESAAEACLLAREALAACEEAEHHRQPAGPTPGTGDGGGAGEDEAGEAVARVVLIGGPELEPGELALDEDAPRRVFGDHEPAILKLLHGDREAMGRIVTTLAGEDGTERRRWQLAIAGLVEAIVARAIEAAALEFPLDHPFWGPFSQAQCRDVATALASFGYRFDGLGGFLDDRVPSQRDLSLAIGYAGEDPMRVRHWPTEREMPELYREVAVAADEFIAGTAPELTLGEMIAVLRGRAEELTDLWNAWGRIRPLLLQP